MKTGTATKISWHGTMLSLSGLILILVMLFNHTGAQPDLSEKSQPFNAESKPLINVDDMLLSIKSFSIYALDDASGE